jgi:hypothetical protein
MGLTGIALSAAIFLGVGQARTLRAPSPIQSIKIQDSLSSRIVSKINHSGEIQSSKSEKVTISLGATNREMDNEEKLNKKRLGLAILFLGALAEKT